MVGFSESQQVSAINKVFADSYKSPLSVIVLDNIERLLGGENAHFSSLLADFGIWVRLGSCWPSFLESCSASHLSSDSTNPSKGMIF